MTAGNAHDVATGVQPASLRGHLPDVDPEWAATVQALLARGDTLDAAADGGRLVLRCETAPGSRAPTLVQLAHADGHILFAQTLGRNEPTIGDLAWHDLAGEARVLAWALSHESLLTALANAFGEQPVPEAFLHDEPATGRHHWLALTFDDAEREVHWEGRLGLDTAAARALAANTAWHFDAQAAAARRARIVVGCELLAPAPPLAVAQLRTLARGDVLILGTRSIALASLRLVVPAGDAQAVESVTWGAKWTDGALTLTQRFAMDAGMTAHAADDDAPQSTEIPEATPAAASPLDTLPARLEVVLATPRLSLGEVEHLAPGQILPLQASLDHATATLRVNGTPFARGELVALGDTLGVRIVGIDDSG